MNNTPKFTEEKISNLLSKKIDRREFCKLSLAFVAGLSVGDHQISKAETETEVAKKIIESISDNQMLKSIYQEINFREDNNRPKRVDQLVSDFVKYFVEFSTHIYSFDNKDIYSSDQRCSEIQSMIQKDKKTFYQRTMIAYPELFEKNTDYHHDHSLDKDFSEENYNYLVSYKLPRYLGKYGIYASLTGIFAAKDDNFLYFETLLQFAKITRIDREKEFSQWNTSIKTPVIYVDDLIIDSTLMPWNRDLLVVANSSYKNIMIDEKVSQQAMNGIYKEKYDSIQNDILIPVRKLSEEQIFVKFNEEAKSIADVSFFASQLLGKRKNNIEYYKNKTEQNIQHEIGHLIDFFYDKNFAKKFIHNLPIFSKPEEYRKNKDFCSFHSELNAILSELRYAKNGNHIQNLIGVHGVKIEDFPPHFRSYISTYQWISKQIIEKVSINPQKYNFKLNQKHSPEWQILFQFANFVEDNISWNALIEEIKRDHQKTYF